MHAENRLVQRVEAHDRAKLTLAPRKVVSSYTYPMEQTASTVNLSSATVDLWRGGEIGTGLDLTAIVDINFIPLNSDKADSSDIFKCIASGSKTYTLEGPEVRCMIQQCGFGAG